MNKFKWYDKELVNKTYTETQKAILKGCLMVEADAKILCPVLTGRLRSSITHEVEKTVGRVGSNVIYSRRIELGFVGTDSLGRTYNQKPKPYLRPALHKNEKKILKLFKNLIK